MRQSLISMINLLLILMINLHLLIMTNSPIIYKKSKSKTLYFKYIKLQNVIPSKLKTTFDIKKTIFLP